MRFSLKSWRSSRYAAIGFGASLTMVGALSVSAPANAASAGGPQLIGGFDSLTGPLTSIRPISDRFPDLAGNQLFGVFCTSPANCWAVGESYFNGVAKNEVLHWTGRHWFKVAVPNPAGTSAEDDNELFAVRCTSASNCWAVGDSQKPKQAELDQALRWNGKKWSVATTPTPAGVLSGDTNMLDDVTCTSANSCWASGSYGVIMPTMTGLSQVVLNQLLHWNGSRWSLVSTPNPSGSATDHVNLLLAVRCASATDCWAAGAFGTVMSASTLTFRNEMLHWTGKQWFKQTVPNPSGTAQDAINEINSLVCASPANCGAVGTTGSINSTTSPNELLNEALHWNGSKWLVQKVPNPGSGTGADNMLLGVTCPLPRNCWAVGSTGAIGHGPPTLNEMLHWNGTKWSLFKVPNPGGTSPDASNILDQVRCTSAANCWAVGSWAKPNGFDQNEMLHWTGRKWFVG